jgi:class 3 adenylate cyclase
MSSTEAPELTGERRTLTVLVAELRDHPKLYENIAPGEALARLNEYLELACPVILDRRGLISEVMGHGLMAMFGAPVADPSAAEHALAAALELQLTMKDFNERQRARGAPEIGQGIGIHTGQAIVGTIGSNTKIMKYAALGASVGIAARLGSSTADGQILASPATVAATGTLATTTNSLEIAVPGWPEPLTALEVTGLGGDYGLDFTARPPGS